MRDNIGHDERKGISKRQNQSGRYGNARGYDRNEEDSVGAFEKCQNTKGIMKMPKKGKGEKDMMKKMRKMIALVLSAIMVLAMGMTAMAAQESNNTITVSNAKNGETYKAYKMLELFVDNTASPTAYRYEVATGWEDFFDNANSAAWNQVVEKDTNGKYFYRKSGVVDEAAWAASSAVSKFAEAAAKYAKENSLSATATQTASSETVVLNTTESGYYLITSTLGTRAMIDTTPGDVTMNEKNDVDSISKQVKEDSTDAYGLKNDAQIGDTVNFKSEVTIVPRSVNVVIHDTMDSGLTLNASSIKVYTDNALTNEYSDATIKTGVEAESGDTFTIKIPDTFAATADASQTLYIVYTAELNKNAIKTETGVTSIVSQLNKTKVAFGNGTTSAEASTTTTTHSLTVHKHNSSDALLANAIFQLKKNGTVVNLVKVDEKNYRIVDDTETGAASSHVASNNEVATIDADTIVSDFVTVASGDIVIWGLDSDNDYTLVEIQAPKGYNLLDAPVNVVYNSDTNAFTDADILNNTGTELPSTGGIGTTIFYVAGTILLLGAAVLLVVRRRMRTEC